MQKIWLFAETWRKKLLVIMTGQNTLRKPSIVEVLRNFLETHFGSFKTSSHKSCSHHTLPKHKNIKHPNWQYHSSCQHCYYYQTSTSRIINIMTQTYHVNNYQELKNLCHFGQEISSQHQHFNISYTIIQYWHYL